MPITEHQRKLRPRSIGSSDVPALFGFGYPPTVTDADLFLVKTDRVPGFAGNVATESGNYMEPGVMRFAEDQLGKIKKNQRRVKKDLYLAVNIDGLVISSGNPVDAKVGFVNQTGQRYGQPDTDDVPEYNILQAHAHMIVTGTDVCHQPVFLPGRGLLMFKIERQPQLCDIISERCVDFWETNVLKDIPPVGTPTLANLRKLGRESKTIDLANDSLIPLWQASMTELRLAKKQSEEIQAALIAQLGDADAATLPDGRMLTFYEQTRKAHAVKESTFRKLLLKQAPKGSK